MLNELQHWLIDQREQVLPKLPLGQAIQYALNHWDALARYTSDGDLVTCPTELPPANIASASRSLTMTCSGL